VSVKHTPEYGIRIGTLFLFALVLPGFAGFFLYSVLYKPYLLEMPVWNMVIYILGFGFVANALGHIFDIVLYRKAMLRIRNRIYRGKRPPFLFGNFPEFIYTQKNATIRNAAEYHFAWFAFMFNSATLILLIPIIDPMRGLISGGTWPFVFEFSLSPLLLTIFSLVCFYLAHFQMSIVHDLCGKV